MSIDDVVHGLWDAVSRRAWDEMKPFLSDDCLYTDMPVGPTLAARGAEDIVKRVKLALGPLASYVNHRGLLVSTGADAMYEHSETWTWESGETALLQFVSVHRVENDKITLWKDYWDYGVIMNTAPQAWHDAVANGDLSWIYDATGQL